MFFNRNRHLEGMGGKSGDVMDKRDHRKVFDTIPEQFDRKGEAHDATVK